MIILLGESTAAREVSKRLQSKNIEYQHIPIWPKKTSLTRPSAILDVSHPSNRTKFAAISQWCEQQDIPYLRLERPETKIPNSPLIFPVHNWEEALLQLMQCSGAMYLEKKRQVTIFVTTGSHQLESIINCSFSGPVRLVVRVLPEGRIVQKCMDMGLHPRNIVAMQGPFSKELNRVLFKFYGADILLTRDSGHEGGTDTKISAALELGLNIVLIKKNTVSSGMTVNSVNELLDWVDKYQPTEQMAKE